MSTGVDQADAIVVGAGLAGLAAAAELAEAGKRVILLDQEPEQSLGGQAFWSFGGLFFVDSPEQRRMGIKDSEELALQDWMGTADFDRPEDAWPRKWAEAYVDFAAGEKYSWLRNMGLRIFPVVGWAERGGYLAEGHGNSVPRFHITWGTGPGLVEPFEKGTRLLMESGKITFLSRHQVDEIHFSANGLRGVSGCVLALDQNERGAESNREVVSDFYYEGASLMIASGGIGGNVDLIREN